MKKPIIITGLIIFISLIYFSLIFQTINYQKIAWQAELNSRCDQFANQEILLTFQEKSWPIKLIDLGFQISSQKTKGQLAALINYYNFKPVYQIDQAKFQDQIDQIFKDIERPAQNASLVFNQEIDNFSLKHSTQGTRINRQQLITDLSERIKNFSNQPVNLILILDKPTIENDQVDSAQQKAEQILANQPYQLILETEIWKINQDRLIDWLKFEPIKESETDNQILGVSLDRDQIREYLKEITSTINQYPIDARLETQDNRAIIFIPAKQGYGIDIDKTVDQLIENILAQSPVRKTIITAEKLLPKISLSQTNSLGINTLIAQGISNFAGSPKNRIHNIKIGLAKFNGLILGPGEEFSFNILLGGSEAEQGFLPELVIKKNKLVPEYGGGLCQVSTTFFRAAINSGLKITERYAHSIPVEYYNPQGFDATVYDPKPDLRFINDRPGHVLIQSFVSGNQVIVNFYGSDDGRQVKIKGPYILEKNEDGSMKAILTQQIYKNGELFSEDIFYSNYKSPDLYPVENEESEE